MSHPQLGWDYWYLNFLEIRFSLLEESQKVLLFAGKKKGGKRKKNPQQSFIPMKELLRGLHGHCSVVTVPWPDGKGCMADVLWQVTFPSPDSGRFDNILLRSWPMEGPGVLKFLHQVFLECYIIASHNCIKYGWIRQQKWIMNDYDS